MSFVTSAIAKKLIVFIEDLVKSESITDYSKIHVFLDESDITVNHFDYENLFKEGRFEEALALPKIPSRFSQPLIEWLWRNGIRVDVYTSKVDTVRVKKTCDSIMAGLNVPGLFNSVFCLRTEDNKVLTDFSLMINEEMMTKDNSNYGIIYCSFPNRIEQFKNTAPEDFFKKTYGVLMA